MRTDYLYKDFLRNKKIYNLNEGYWTQTLNELVAGVCIADESSKGFQKWLKNKFSNGQKFYDANPIFSAFCETQNKAIRIIQEEPETEGIEISAWIDVMELDDNRKVEELVISLELSKSSKKIAEKLIKFWISKEINSDKMRIIIDNEKPQDIIGQRQSKIPIKAVFCNVFPQRFCKKPS